MVEEYAPSSMVAAALQRAARGPRGAPFTRCGDAVEQWLEAEREQLALWLPVGLGLGIAAWFALPDRAGWIGFVLGALALVAMGLTLAGGTRAGRCLIGFGLAAALGCLLVWWRADRVGVAPLARPTVTSFAATIADLDRLSAKQSVRLLLAPDPAAALPGLVRVSVDAGGLPDAAAVGARVRLRARLVPPPVAAVPGAYDFARIAWFQGIGAAGKAIGAVTVSAPAPEGGFSATLARWRDRLAAHIHARLPGGEGGIAAALAAGDQGGISQDDAEAMRRSGLAHLLSVSGLHLAAAVGATMLVTLRLLALSPALALRLPLVLIAAGAGAVGGIAYTLLTGSEVPTVRSCIAALLILGGIALGREPVTLRLVAAGALIVMLLWPESLVGPSFQLSFAAIAAIVAVNRQPHVAALLAKRDEGVAARLARELGGLLLTGLAVEIALAPIALYHFHRSGLYGSVANLVAIPLTTFVIMPLEAAALLLDMVGLGAPLWWLTGRALALLLWLAHAVAAAPGAVARLPAMPEGAFALMMAGGLWIGLWRTRIRRLGLIPLAAGALWAAVTPSADILVTGDGKHVAVRDAAGALYLLRPRAGDYIRSTLGETEGLSGDDALALDDLPSARCGTDLCAVDIARGGRTWRLLATRSPYLVAIADMNRACAGADIVVSDRRLPRGCRPRWLKADAPFLSRSGGLAIRLAGRSVEGVAVADGEHPWRRAPGLNDSGAAARRAYPGRGPGAAHSAADRRRGWRDRGGSSSPRGGNI